jgi:hypothetical protein
MLFVIANIMLVFTLGTCVFALTKGGTAERIGACVILGNIAAAMLNGFTLHNQIVDLAIDGLTALILLGVAVRYASFWQGAVMLLYAMQFGLHAFYFVLDRPRDLIHIIVNDVIFFLVSVCLAAGTGLAWSRRRAAA